MTVQKLSQIAPAVLPVGPTDTVVGVQGGTTDAQYTLQQIASLPLASADPRYVLNVGELILYVATTGNDSGPGTQAQPYLTIQRALQEAGRFNYQYGNEPNIQVAAGTYTIPGPPFGEPVLALPAVFGVNPLDSGLLQGAGVGSTVIVVTSNPFAAFAAGPSKACNWRIGDLTVDCTTIALFSLNGTISSFNMEYRDSTAGGALEIARAENSGEIFLTQNQTITATTFKYLFHLFFTARGFASFTTLTFPASCTVTSGGAVISVSQHSNCWFAPTIINGGGVSGLGVRAVEASVIFTNNGMVSDVPGGAPTPTDIDITSGIVKQTSSAFTADYQVAFGSYFAQQFAGIPTVANISPGMWTVVKDTTGGGVYVLYNDAGTIRTLAFP